MNEALPSDIDAAIRYGAGKWPDVTSDYIAGCEFVCIYAPELLKQGRRITSPVELSSHPLLHHEEALQAWRQWATHHNFDETRILSGPRFAEYSAVIQAVLSGLGVGLVPRILVEEELYQGRAIAFGESISVDQGHYFCFAADRLERPAFAAFRSWLLGLPERPALPTPGEFSPRPSPAPPDR